MFAATGFKLPPRSWAGAMADDFAALFALTSDETAFNQDVLLAQARGDLSAAAIPEALAAGIVPVQQSASLEQQLEPAGDEDLGLSILPTSPVNDADSTDDADEPVDADEVVVDAGEDDADEVVVDEVDGRDTEGEDT